MRFEGAAFVQFLYNYLLSVRNKVWSPGASESQGQYFVSCEVVRLLRCFVETPATEYAPYRAAIETQLQRFLDHYNETHFEESEALLCLLGGGDFLGLSCGSVGRTRNDNKITVLGFAKEWFNKEGSLS